MQGTRQMRHRGPTRGAVTEASTQRVTPITHGELLSVYKLRFDRGTTRTQTKEVSYAGR